MTSFFNTEQPCTPPPPHTHKRKVLDIAPETERVSFRNLFILNKTREQVRKGLTDFFDTEFCQQRGMLAGQLKELTSLPVPELLKMICRKDWTRISPESSLTYIRRPNG